MNFSEARMVLIRDGWTPEDSYAVLNLARNAGPQTAACGCLVTHDREYRQFRYDNLACVFRQEERTP